MGTGPLGLHGVRGLSVDLHGRPAVGDGSFDATNTGRGAEDVGGYAGVATGKGASVEVATWR